MNAHMWFDSTRLVRVSPPVPLVLTGELASHTRQIDAPRLRIVREPERIESLHEFVVRTQRGIDSAERIAFVALGGAGLAGVVASFWF